MDNTKYNHYSGIIHVHSTYSDGTRSVNEIAEIANELDINFILITDHNTILNIIQIRATRVQSLWRSRNGFILLHTH